MRTEVLPRHARTRLSKCLNTVCDYWCVSASDVLGKSRKQNIVSARHSLRYFLTNYGDLTLCDVATLTNCDHSNVIHSVKTFKIFCEYDDDFRSFKRIIISETVKDIDYSTNGKVRKIIKSNASITKKVELIKKIFANENQ